MIFQQKHPWILASSSPRRKQYLELYGFKFKTQSPDIVETPLAKESPVEFVTRMAKEKGAFIYNNPCLENTLVLSADTIVNFQDQILGKPTSQKHALQILKQLNGNTHEVITAFHLFETESNTSILKTLSTQVKFKQLHESLLEAYIHTEEPLDKAGSYSIQGIGSFLVESIEGSFHNVVGLPIEHVIEELWKQKWIHL